MEHPQHAAAQWATATVEINTVKDLQTGVLYMATAEGNLVPLVNTRSGEIYSTRVLRKDPLREVIPTPNDYHVLGRFREEDAQRMPVHHLAAQALQANLGALNLSPPEASINAMIDALVEQYLPVLVEQQSSLASLVGEALVLLVEQRKGNVSMQHVRCSLEAILTLLQFVPEESLEYVVNPMALAERGEKVESSLILAKG